MKVKTCTVDNCNNPLFARGYCSYHYRSIYLYNKQKDKPKKQYFIPKVSEKTKQRNKLYTEKREQFIADQKNQHLQKKVFCIFCSKEIKGKIDLHHGLGRDDDVMLDERFWFLAHNFCHVHQYHSMSYEKLAWWDGYIDRIKDIPEIYELELKKMDK